MSIEYRVQSIEYKVYYRKTAKWEEGRNIKIIKGLGNYVASQGTCMFLFLFLLQPPFLLTWPSGPDQSQSRDIQWSVCVSIPHYVFQASHLGSYHMINFQASHWTPNYNNLVNLLQEILFWWTPPPSKKKSSARLKKLKEKKCVGATIRTRGGSQCLPCTAFFYTKK